MKKNKSYKWIKKKQIITPLRRQNENKSYNWKKKVEDYKTRATTE